MRPARAWNTLVCVAWVLVGVTALAAAAPQVGYVYPAGARQASTITVAVGGQSLQLVDEVHVSGDGVRGSVLEHVRALNNEELRKTASFLRDLVRRRWSAAAIAAARQSTEGPPLPDHPWLRDLDDRSPDELARLWATLFDPRRQPNAQIAEQVLITVTVDPEAAVGDRQLRLVGRDGVSNPVTFQVGTLPEVREEELTLGGGGIRAVEPPLLLNGQVLPGEIDRYRLQLRRGQRLVIRLLGRALIPYLADAVPGWFQAVLRLCDPQGTEVVCNDDFRGDPDPVLLYEVPVSGIYTLQVYDALYRGREDFVYRIAVGEVPFVTGLFPLGGREGTPAKATLTGWNLPATTLTLDTRPGGDAIREALVGAQQGLVNRVRYAVSDLPEVYETDDSVGAPREVPFPAVVNGRIGQPGDVDLIAFEGRAGQEIVAEVYARRLGTPLDSVLRVVDASGSTVALNDDYKDREVGLLTHQADSYVRVQLPADGVYRVYLWDAQRQGGEDWGYRLYLRQPRPDFALRLVPSGINVPAGRSATANVHVLRKDGFAGEVQLVLSSAPAGLTLTAPRIGADVDTVTVTLTAASGTPRQVAPVRLEGQAIIGAATVAREAVPAEDMMQAFLWRFLVPQQELLVATTGSRPVPAVWRPLAPGLKLASPALARIPLGGTAQVQVQASATLPDARATRLDELCFRLCNRPRGITLREVTRTATGVTLTLQADRNMALVGDTANLIIEVFAGTGGASLGVLPAFPYEVVGP